MSNMIVCSGPQSHRAQALGVLKDAGYEPVLDGTSPTLRDWGFAKIRKTDVFLTVEGIDPNVDGYLEPFNWRHRAHWETPEPIAERTIEEKLRAIGIMPDDLRAYLLDAVKAR